MKIISLYEAPHFFEPLITLIEDSFQYSEKNHFEIDFFPLVEEKNWKNNFLLIDENGNEGDGQILGHIGVKIRELSIPGIESTAKEQVPSLELALLGGIAIHKNFRGRGYFKFLLNEVIKRFEESVSCFILWSDLEEFYEKFFFYPCGEVIEIKKKENAEKNNFSSLNRGGVLLKEYDSLSDLDDDMWRKIQNLFESSIKREKVHFKRDPFYWKEIRNISSCKLLTFELEDKRLFASPSEKNSNILGGYAFFNKGQDLENVIHEIGYDGLIFNFSEIALSLLEVRDLSLWLTPKDYKEIATKKLDNFDTTSRYLMYLRIGNRKLFQSLSELLSLQKLSISHFNDKSKMIEFNFNEDSYECSRKEFVQNIFGPKREFNIFYKDDFFISGLDSI